MRLVDWRAQRLGSVWHWTDLHRMYQDDHKSSNADGGKYPQSIPYGGVTFKAENRNTCSLPCLFLASCFCIIFPKLNSLFLVLCQDGAVMGGVGECLVWRGNVCGLVARITAILGFVWVCIFLRCHMCYTGPRLFISAVCPHRQKTGRQSRRKIAWGKETCKAHSGQAIRQTNRQTNRPKIWHLVGRISHTCSLKIGQCLWQRRYEAGQTVWKKIIQPVNKL